MSDDRLDRAVTGGVVRGRSSAAIDEWRGVPYAAPPVGARRLRAPAPVIPWTGVRDATRFGPVATQDRKGPFGGAAPSTPRSEDCLTLNIAAPSGADSLPVMVFIHGGAYSVGSPADSPWRGTTFVRRGVVHVTLNYRLNALGYLDFSEFGFDTNLGLRDQVAALEWVRDNIARFGGDPERVTVYGESSGGNAVTTLMTTPVARGLFARAIAQSPPSNAVYWPHDTRRSGRDFLRLLGAPVGREAEALRDASADALVTAARLLFAEVPDAYPGDLAFSPVVDGAYLPEHPFEAFRRGHQHDIPLLIGTTGREGSVFWGKRRILATTRSRREGLLAATPPAAREHFARAYRFGTRRDDLDFGGDFAFWFPSQRLAEQHSARHPAWLYRLDYAPPLLRLLGIDATHGADLITVFERERGWVGRLSTLLGGARDLRAVGERMREHWYTFAATGTLPEAWPRYSPERRESLSYDMVDRVERDTRRDRRLAWAGWVPLHSAEGGS
ncbi:carboxylesterase family protein [Galbitalea soli]|uniref:Carboxylic ester hydrolase n=1 Tax=Galbitalea soli TaxID=1268042 RepID=A0A7C9TNZ4_9MICO|nr:carboxylesterase/lipase family protein [Galbitalea soli]NYJ30667.1 para-nitrobenzyl esterase [Galbitalea soli]